MRHVHVFVYRIFNASNKASPGTEFRVRPAEAATPQPLELRPQFVSCLKLCVGSHTILLHYNRQIMKKLGIGKKKDGDDNGNHRALFGGRSKDKSTTPSTNNPYANLPTQADAYNQAKARAGVPGYTQAQRGPSPAPPPAQPSGSVGMNGGYLDEKKSGGYGDEKTSIGFGAMEDPAPRGGYGADRYGASSGYGADRYGTESSQAGDGGSRYGPGGYGGLGAAPVPEDSKDSSFGGANDRSRKQEQQQVGYGEPPPYEEGRQEGGYGRSTGPSYEAYGDRQLTAEEEEEEDVLATKQQIRFIKQEDVSSTRNALRMAAQA